MELNLLIIFIRRWLWLLFLGALLGLAAGYVISEYQTPVYRASTKVMITGEQIEQGGTTGRQSLQELVGTYTQLLLTRSVATITGERLGYGVNPGRITVQQIPNTKLFQVHYESPDPERAAETANMLVQVLVEQNNALQSGRVATSVSGLETQLSQIEGQIAALESEVVALHATIRQNQETELATQIARLETTVSNLQREIVNLTAEFVQANTADDGSVAPYSVQQDLQLQEKGSALSRAEAELGRYQQALFDLSVLGKTSVSEDENSGDNVQIAQLNTQLNLYRQIYSNLLSEYELARMTNLGAATGVVLVDAATAPGQPLRPRPVTNMVFGAALGLLLIAALAFVVEYLDDSVKSPQTAANLFGSPVIGHINFARSAFNEEMTHAAANPRSPVTESLRKLRTNLEFAKVDSPLRTLFVTSANPAEGKTTVVANLAIVMAQAGQKVIVVDADLRRPNLHNVLGTSNKVGLTDVLIGRIPLADAMQNSRDTFVSVLASGPIPPNPAELLRSARMSGVIQELSAMADIVLIDGPPFVVADAALLAAKVDGVLPVVRYGQTRIGALTAMNEQLQQVQAKVVGVILNGIKTRGRGGYYNQYYYYRHEYPASPEKARSRWRIGWPRRRGEQDTRANG